MAVYTEDKDGKLELVKKDLSVNDLEKILIERKAKEGLESSTCIKDNLSFKVTSIDEE